MKKVKIYTDGGARGNPGPAGAGVVFCNEKGEIFKKFSQYLGDKLTNNEAEYLAVVLALKKFKKFFGSKIAKVTQLTVNADSQLLVKQMNGEYKVKDEKIQKLFIEVWNLKTNFQEVKFNFIKREKNKEADSLVNEALDNHEKTNNKLL
jgi:ribonuclease HI